MDNAKNRTLIQTKLSEIGLGEAQVKFVKAETPTNRGRPQKPVPETPAQAEPAGPAPVPPIAAREKQEGPPGKPRPIHFTKDEFKDDPLIQKALEIFKGQIVEVRA